MSKYRVRVTKQFDVDVDIDWELPTKDDERRAAERIAVECDTAHRDCRSSAFVQECYDDPALTVQWHALGAFRKPVLVFEKRRGSDGFTQEECDALYELASSLFEVTGHWNGSPGMTYSMSLTDEAVPLLKEWTGENGA